MTAVSHYTFLRAFNGAVLGVSRDQYPIAITPSELFEDELGREEWMAEEWPIVRDIVCGLFNLPLDSLDSIPEAGLLSVYDGGIALVKETSVAGISRIIMVPVTDPSSD